MRLVICDTSPLNYLVIIGQINILPVLFTEIVISKSVWRELRDPDAPREVQVWMDSFPGWITVRPDPAPSFEEGLHSIDDGERTAIQLAVALSADLLLIDERKGTKLAKRKQLRVIGTLGILDLAAKRGLLDLADAFEKLRQTSFHCPESVMARLLAEHERERHSPSKAPGD